MVTTIIHSQQHNTSIKLVADRQTDDRQADIVTYRAAFAAKNAKYKCKMQNITTECSNIINYNNSNDNCTLTTA